MDFSSARENLGAFTPTRRRVLGLMGLGAAAMFVPGPGRAAAPRLGWLVYGAPPAGLFDRTLHDALIQRGLVRPPGDDIAWRFASGRGERLEPLAVELASLQPAALLGIGGDIVRALRKASATIPIVGGVSDDPVLVGLAASLARPGGNFTGVTFLMDEMVGKRLQLLREILPALRRVGAIWNPTHLDNEMVLARDAAAHLGLEISPHEAEDAGGIRRALADAVGAGAECLFVIASRLTSLHVRTINEFALAHRMPVVTAWREFAELGALMTYGPNRREQARRLASHVERVLAGGRPADIPIERPTEFELVVNLATARTLGVPVPQSVLARADYVIE